MPRPLAANAALCAISLYSHENGFRSFFSVRPGFCSAQFGALSEDESVWTLEGQEVSNELVEGDGEKELKAMSWLTQRFPGSLG